MSRQPEKPSNVKAKHGLHRKTRRKKMGLENRPVLEPNAAGIHIGAREMFVAVPPGRRTDWHECQWLQYLHSVGLLRGAFRPEADVCAMRVLVRHRGELVQAASQHVQD